MHNRSMTPVPHSSPFLVRAIGRAGWANIFPAATYAQAVGIAKARGLDALILSRRPGGGDALVATWSSKEGVQLIDRKASEGVLQ
jgi:hypothetical protein